jgi:putative transposase
MERKIEIYFPPIFTLFWTILMATKAQNARQAYGLTDELVDSLLQGSTSHEEVFGEDGIYRQLTKRLFERMLETEMTHHLGYEKHQKPEHEQRLVDGGNARNGSSSKNVKTVHSQVELSIPRDRHGQFVPRIIPKGTTRLPEIERTILALYGGGMSTRDIAAELERAYGIDASPTFISDVTDSILEDVKQWRNRPVDAVYPVAFFDGFRLNVRDNGKVISKCLYVALAVDISGHKQCLGLWIAHTESASFWLQVFTELRNRGLEDILIATTDGLTGFTEAVHSAFPQCMHQTCIVHLLRNTMALVATKDRKAVARDFKLVYTAPNEEEALRMLDNVEKTWKHTYPALSQSWRNNWAKVVPMFGFMPELRRLIYTSNPIESVNRGLRKSVKTRTIFPNDEAVFKLMFLTMQRLESKWTMPIQSWARVLNQLLILFPRRLPTSL